MWITFLIMAALPFADSNVWRRRKSGWGLLLGTRQLVLAYLAACIVIFFAMFSAKAGWLPTPLVIAIVALAAEGWVLNLMLRLGPDGLRSSIMGGTPLTKPTPPEPPREPTAYSPEQLAQRPWLNWDPRRSTGIGPPRR